MDAILLNPIHLLFLALPSIILFLLCVLNIYTPCPVLAAHKRPHDQNLFGIVQGGLDPVLR